MADPLIASDAAASEPATGRLLLVFVLVFLACCAMSVALPHDRYIRFQQLGSSAMFPGLWAYERTTFDPTPIDVAVIGPSRVQVAVSAPQLGALLTAKIGRPVHVVNFGTPHDGRNLQYELTKQLLATHPEVKLIIFMLGDRGTRRGHPKFREIADVRDVLTAPVVSPSYLSDIAFLPYRQLSLFAQTQYPALFGARRNFDPALYRGTNYDTTLSYEYGNGVQVDRDAIIPASELGDAKKHIDVFRAPPLLPEWAADYEFSIDRTYFRAVDAAARRNGTGIAFLYIPLVTDREPLTNQPLYNGRGPIFEANFISVDTRSYADFVHLNHSGAEKVTAWLAERLMRAQRAGQLDMTPRGRR